MAEVLTSDEWLMKLRQHLASQPNPQSIAFAAWERVPPGERAGVAAAGAFTIVGRRLDDDEVRTGRHRIGLIQ
jgi:hypothetical protein